MKDTRIKSEKVSIEELYKQRDVLDEKIEKISNVKEQIFRKIPKKVWKNILDIADAIQTEKIIDFESVVQVEANFFIEDMRVKLEDPVYYTNIDRHIEENIGKNVEVKNLLKNKQLALDNLAKKIKELAKKYNLDEEFLYFKLGWC